VHRVGLLLVGALLLAQGPAEEQARKLLDDGRSYWSKGQFKQALDNFNTIVTGFSNTDSASSALLEIGRYHAEIEGNEEKGREAFEEVVKRFPQSGGAPGAYYYLGLLAMNRASTPAQLDDALAQFTRVQRLYSKSDWVPKAIHAGGLVHRKAGRLLEAVEAERRVSLEHPNSDAAPAAQFQIGDDLALLGEPRQAMEEYQQVRNRFPESPWANLALERVTALYRLYGGSKPSFALDTTFQAGAGDVLKDVRAVLMTPTRTLWIASDKVKSVVSYAGGKMGPSVPGEDIHSLSLSPRGDLVVAARLAVRIGPKDVKTFAVPTDKSGVMEALDHISAAAVTQGGVLVADEKKKRVYRYDAQYQYKGLFPDAKEREIVRIVVDGEGGVVLLDREEKTVRAFDEGGHALRSIGPKGTGFEFKHPTDVAVDQWRNTYVVDEEAGVYIFAQQGQLMATLRGEELKRPKALTLDPTGALLVYDDRSQRILRYN